MDFQLTEEQLALQEAATGLARAHFADKALTWEGFAWDNARILAQNGFTGITIRPEDGGQGGTLMDAVLVMEAVSKVCPQSGDAVQATNFGAIRQIAEFGSDRVKQEILPVLLSGEGVVSAGMSETEAGSALTQLTTTAERDGDDIVINGHKLWGTHAPDVTHTVVWARFGPRTRDIGCVVVPTDLPGVSKGATETYMSGEHHCPIYFDNVRVPADYVLVEHEGLRKMFTIFGVERVGNATRALALAEAAFEQAVEHASTREQFGRPLCEFQGLQWKFAEMRMKLDAARLLIYRAVTNADTGAPSPAEATIAKCYTNEISFEVAHEALQVLGAMGYSTQTPMEYYLRRIRGWMIAGGSVEMLKNRIAEDVFGRRFSQRAPKPTA